MNKKNMSRISLIKVIFIFLILVLLSGAGVMAVATQINTVTIKLSNGYEMEVLTSKTTVKEILEEKNIILEENEKVVPSLEESIKECKQIVITDKSEQEIEIAKLSENEEEISLETMLGAYSEIIEKIETKEEIIPFETITKDISNGSEDTKNKVLQEGIEGKKIVTYKVKYQNDVEIERTEISQEIVQEPVDKIIQVRANKISSRAKNNTRSSIVAEGSSNVKIYKVTAYCACSKCCGRSASGYTASGTKATAGRTVAASSSLPFGTKLNINGNTYVVEDRGGSIKGNRIDIYVNSHSEAISWGVKYLPVEIKD